MMQATSRSRQTMLTATFDTVPSPTRSFFATGKLKMIAGIMNIAENSFVVSDVSSRLQFVGVYENMMPSAYLSCAKSVRSNSTQPTTTKNIAYSHCSSFGSFRSSLPQISFSASSSTTDSTRKKRLRFLLSANRSIARPQSHAASVDASIRKMYFGSAHRSPLRERRLR